MFDWIDDLFYGDIEVIFIEYFEQGLFWVEGVYLLKAVEVEVLVLDGGAYIFKKVFIQVMLCEMWFLFMVFFIVFDQC